MGLISFLLTHYAMAASSGTLFLQGTVPATTSIVVTATAGASTLDIVNGETNKKVADSVEVSNHGAGYKIMVSSLNGGTLKQGSQSVAYQLSYNGSSMLTLTTNPQQVKNVTSLSQLTTSTNSVNVNVTAQPNALDGTYTDTVTLSIVAN